MKKLITLMMGLALVFGTVAVTFGQEAPAPQKTEKTKKKSGKKKASKKKAEEPK
jgi:hypothetical protein